MTRCLLTVSFTLTVLFGSSASLNAGNPLSSDDILQLHKLGIKPAAIVEKINSDGISFVADPNAIAQLEQSGIPAGIIAATQQQAGPTNAEPPITFGNVTQLLKLGIAEAAVIERLESSPTLFTLDAGQEQELRSLGASDQLLAVLRGERRQQPSSTDEKVTDMAVILDCSGSMSETSSDGETKIEGAKRVVSRMISTFPDGLRVSFIIYGGENAGCNAVQVVRPLSSLDASGKNTLQSAVHNLKAGGKTPIALALRRAGQELAKFDAVSGVVLISDGKETCGGDPAAEAATLAKRFKLRYGVTVFGFDVAGEERVALENIATAGGGDYYNASSVQELVEKVAAAQSQIEVEPVAVTTVRRRAVVVTTPRVEFPAMKKIALIEARRPLPERHNYRAITEIENYDRPIRIPSSKKTYDLGFLPAEGMAVRLSPGIQIPDRSTIQVRPEDYLGLVNVTGEGLPAVKLIALVRPGTAGPGHNFAPIQTAERYGADLLVPAGNYDLWIQTADGKRELLEEDLTVTAGQRVQLD